MICTLFVVFISICTIGVKCLCIFFFASSQEIESQKQKHFDSKTQTDEETANSLLILKTSLQFPVNFKS